MTADPKARSQRCGNAASNWRQTHLVRPQARRETAGKRRRTVRRAGWVLGARAGSGVRCSRRRGVAHRRRARSGGGRLRFRGVGGGGLCRWWHRNPFSPNEPTVRAVLTGGASGVFLCLVKTKSLSCFNFWKNEGWEWARLGGEGALWFEGSRGAAARRWDEVVCGWI
jgi:hypothetical protein